MSDEHRAEIAPKLEKVHQRLANLFQALAEAQWQTVIYPDSGWTTEDVLRHLVSAEPGLHLNIERIRQGGAGASAEFDLDRWNDRQIHKLQERSRAELLDQFDRNHQATLALLQRIEPDDWEKQGRHALVGMLTIEGWLNLIGLHNRQHLRDIQQALGEAEA